MQELVAVDSKNGGADRAFDVASGEVGKHPWIFSADSELLEGLKNFFDVSFDFDFLEYFSDHSLFVDDEGGPHNPHELFPVKLFFLPHAVFVDHLLAFVRDQVERQVVFPDEFLVSLRGIDADAENGGVFELFILIPEITGFGSAAGGHVPGVKIQDHIFLAFERTQLNGLPILVLCRKIGRFVSFFNHNFK